MTEHMVFVVFANERQEHEPTDDSAGGRGSDSEETVSCATRILFFQ